MRQSKSKIHTFKTLLKFIAALIYDGDALSERDGFHLIAKRDKKGKVQ